MAQPRIKRYQKYSTVIGSNIKVLGNVIFSGGLYVDGEIQGEVAADSEGPAVLTLDENSVVEGDVRAPQILLNGEVSGNVYASEHAELLGKARISGNLYYRSLQMALGAEVNGQLVHTDEFDEGGAVLESKTPPDKAPEE